MVKSKSHDEVIEAICDYRKGWTNLDSATKELGELAGLSPDIAAAFPKDICRAPAGALQISLGKKENLTRLKNKRPPTSGISTRLGVSF